MSEAITMKAIGHIHSSLEQIDEAPRQGDEGAPDAWLEVLPEYGDALLGIAPGDALVVLTWLHQADRERLQIHPRGNPEAPLTGVFATRAPHRPNPIGIHPVLVRAVEGTRLLIGPIEAVDGTPVLDIKADLGPIQER